MNWGLLRQRRLIDWDCQENKVRTRIKFMLRLSMKFSGELRDSVFIYDQRIVSTSLAVARCETSDVGLTPKLADW
jgi:hypothetical protein